MFGAHGEEAVRVTSDLAIDLRSTASSGGEATGSIFLRPLRKARFFRFSGASFG